jgi:hypothetical protein
MFFPNSRSARGIRAEGEASDSRSVADKHTPEAPGNQPEQAAARYDHKRAAIDGSDNAKQRRHNQNLA